MGLSVRCDAHDQMSLAGGLGKVTFFHVLNRLLSVTPVLCLGDRVSPSNG